MMVENYAAFNMGKLLGSRIPDFRRQTRRLRFSASRN
jgi:hypothetical protein